jgi:hypothetical protein
MEVLEFHGPGEGRIKEVRVRPGSLLSFGKLILIYQVLIAPVFRRSENISVTADP